MDSTLTTWDTVALEDCLSQPSDRTIEALDRCGGDVLVLGAGGKMGPSLCRMVRRCFNASGSHRRVVAVSRFSDQRASDSLSSAGVETVTGDLTDPRFLASLPECENVVFMVGRKFGTGQDRGQTWATNTYLPGLVCERFSGRRIVCLSTGNVYGLVDVNSKHGSQEADPLAPVGEYAQSCVGRERVVEFFSRRDGTPVSTIRLNYATELRYGVLVDLACKIKAGEPIPLSIGYFNVIWQADACELTLRSLAHAASPPAVFNVTGLETASCREVANRLAETMGTEAKFSGTEGDTALLSDARHTREVLGEPQVSLEQMIGWVADWVARGGATWGKPTHFEVRNGSY